MSTLSLRSILAGYVDAINGAADKVPANVLSLDDTQRLANALQNALDSLDGLKTAEEQAMVLLNDTTRSATYRINTCDTLRTTAAAKATGALSTLRSIADSTYAKVSSAWQPGKPKGVDNTLLIDRKADLCRLLDAHGDDAHRILHAAGKLLKDALLAGDDDSLLTAYVLASGPMDLYYRSRGIAPDVQAQSFAAAVGSRTNADGKPISGAALEPLIGQGEGTLSGFIYAAQSEIATTIASMKAKADQWATIFAGQGTYKPGDPRPEPGSVDPMAEYLRRRR